MNKIDELAEKILEYQADVDWYGLCDDYGNIETEPEVRNQVLEEIINTLTNDPNSILESLNRDAEELECDEGYEETKEYKRVKELIKEVEEYKELNQEEDMEM